MELVFWRDPVAVDIQRRSVGERVVGEQNNRRGEQVKYSSERRWKCRKTAFVAFLHTLFFKGEVNSCKLVPLLCQEDSFFL